MTRDAILIHSKEHLAALISECTLMDDDETEKAMEGDTAAKSTFEFPESEGDSKNHLQDSSDRTYDILRLETERDNEFLDTGPDDIENDVASSNHLQDEGFLPENSHGFINSYTGNVEKMGDLEESYHKLEEEYKKYEEETLTDSLKMQQRNTDEIMSEVNSNDSPDEVLYRMSPQLNQPLNESFESNEETNQYGYNPRDSIDPNYVNKHGSDFETSNRGIDPDSNTNKPLPNFKFKGPSLKFLQKNKSTIGKERQGSYCQQYLTKKAKDERMMRMNKKQSELDYQTSASAMLNIEGLNHPHYDMRKSESNFMEEMDKIKHLRENLEISRLEEMIKAEEGNLKHNVIDLDAQHLALNLHNDHLQYNDMSPRMHQRSHHVESISFMDQRESPRISIPELPKNQGSTYAVIHSMQSFREKVNQDENPGYAAQHLEKKVQHNYKKYSLREYKALNKDLKLNQSLGPDLLSNEYLEKKARTEKQKDYAALVATHNRQNMAFKKSRSAPAPSIKDRLRDSKRVAALDYAKSIRGPNARKVKKPSSQPRPMTYESKEMSAIEIMKQRHDAEKKAIDEMRQNLASIIKEMK